MVVDSFFILNHFITFGCVLLHQKIDFELNPFDQIHLIELLALYLLEFPIRITSQ